MQVDQPIWFYGPENFTARCIAKHGRFTGIEGSYKWDWYDDRPKEPRPHLAVIKDAHEISSAGKRTSAGISARRTKRTRFL